MKNPSVLFLSADDFKEKSIQVIRKTPEAYIRDGWEVHYIVSRDNSNKGNYFYEREININGLALTRVYPPLTAMLNNASNEKLIKILFRLRRYMALGQLIYFGARTLRKREFDVVYGYEQLGFLSARFLKLLSLTGKAKIVARFQGVLYVKEWLNQKKWARKISNADTFYALKTKSDICIITNDGSQGNNILKQLGSKHLKNFYFFVNGVDKFDCTNSDLENLKKELSIPEDKKLMLSVSRLDDHKRIDRCIRVLDKIVNKHNYKNIYFLIVGEGAMKPQFEALVENFKLEDYVRFTGAVPQAKVKYYLGISDIFISMYESSNVGNPLLEAINANKLIVTLDNGDTGQWIKHGFSGLIYPIDDVKDVEEVQYQIIAQDIEDLLEDHAKQTQIKQNLKEGAFQALYSWETRLDKEIAAVKRLLVK
ncbi:MAG: glycosyltransferase family 4 protein [Flavobacterium sp.]|nr:glycosyltransferase family 4 protein [Pedobacter sp.]